MRRSLLVFVAVVLAAATARADIGDPDRLAAYTDAAWTRAVTTNATAPDTVTIHFVLEGPSRGGDIASLRQTFAFGSLKLLAVSRGHVEQPYPFVDYHEMIIEGEDAIPIVDRTEVFTMTFEVPDTGAHVLSGSGADCTIVGETDTYTLHWPYQTSAVAWINPPPPQLHFTVTSYFAGEILVGVESQNNLSLVNTGGPSFAAPAFVSSSGAFRIDDLDDLAMISPGRNRAIRIRFTPPTVGLHEASLDVGDASLAMAGLGRGAEYLLSRPDTLMLPPGLVGQIRTAALPVFNEGRDPVPLVTSPLTCGDFTVTPIDAPASLMPGQWASFSVRYTVRDSVTNFCAFDVAAPPAAGAGTFVAVGSAREPNFLVTVSTDTLDFDPAEVGSTSSASVTVRNSGDFPARIVPVIAPAGEPFQYLGAPEFDLAPGQGVTLHLRCGGTTPGEFAAVLELGEDCPAVVLRGSVVERLYALEVDPPVLEFTDTTPGTESTRTFTMRNTGAAPLTLEMRCPDPQVSVPTGSEPIAPGEVLAVTVGFVPAEYGYYEFTSRLVHELDVMLPGRVWPRFDFGPDENRVALHFDPDFATDEITIEPVPQVVPAHLVLHAPSDALGVLGWECRLGLPAGVTLAGWDTYGDVINASDPPEFTVGLASPLPQAANVPLATFYLLAWDVARDELPLSLLPKSVPSLIGLMAWAPGSDVENLTAMLPASGDSVVARIRVRNAVAIALPTPRVEAGPDGVRLTWPNGAGPDGGYHVWRRVGDGPARRLTATVLTADGPEIVWFDATPGRRPDALTTYAYALVVAGRELGRSPEAGLDAGDLPQVTRLLPNVPNPFNPSTAIRFEVARMGPVEVAVYDLAGRRVRTLVAAEMAPGAYAPLWDGRDDGARPVPSGAYMVRLMTPDGVDRRKVTLLK